MKTAPALDDMLRVDEVMRLTGLSRATLWRLSRAGLFPAKYRLTNQAIGWRRCDIEVWLAERRGPAPAAVQAGARGA